MFGNYKELGDGVMLSGLGFRVNRMRGNKWHFSDLWLIILLKNRKIMIYFNILINFLKKIFPQLSDY